MVQKFCRIFFLGPILLAASTGLAQPCARQDPWDPVTRMPRGPLRHECIDTSVKRPVSILGRQPGNFSLEEGEYLLANFRHRGKFWLARLRTRASQAIVFERQPIVGAPVSHVRARVLLSRPLELIWDQSQGPLPTRADINERLRLPPLENVSEVILTVEGGRSESTQGQAWRADLPEGTYPLVLRFRSTDSPAEDDEGPAVSEMVPLQLDELRNRNHLTDADLRQKFLTTYLERSFELGFNESYSLFGRNCSLELFQTLDLAWGDFYPPRVLARGLLPRLADSMPELMRERLRSRRLTER